ncbi:MAG: hypothetical protein ABI212_02315 [Burkholderiaceae bacterium]
MNSRPLFFDLKGEQLPYRVIGFEPPDRFLTSLEHGLSPASN